MRRWYLLVIAGVFPNLVASCGWVLQLPEPFEEVEDTNGTSGATTGDFGGAGSSQGGSGETHYDTGGSSPGGAPGTGGAKDSDMGGAGLMTSTGSDSGGMTGTGATSGTGGSGDPVDPPCEDECDCDADGEDSIACGGKDCDDDDELVFPGQAEFYREPNENVGFDYDCSGDIERNPDLDERVSCGSLLQLSCKGVGFEDQKPACGTDGVWGECEWDGLECVFSPITAKERMECH